MKTILKPSADLKDYDDNLYLLDTFLHTASTLKGAIYDGITQTQKSVGFGTRQYWEQQLITTFYLLRHTLELALKALIKELSDIKVKSHNLEML